MAERYSTVPHHTLAFQERANTELTILNSRLHDRLKHDLTREVYNENVLKHKEDAVIAQLKKVNASLKDPDPGSPESDVFLTPKASPSEVPQAYSQGCCNFQKSDVTNTDSLSNYRKGNSLYYSLVHVEDDLNTSTDKCSVLEKELAEQDELFKSFQSIIIREGKSKAKKPVTLNLCNNKKNKNKNVLTDEKSAPVLKYSNTRLCKIALQENQKAPKLNTCTQADLKYSKNCSKNPRLVKKVSKTYNSSNVENVYETLDEMTTKKCLLDKREHEEVMSNPEADFAGPDSCLEAGSSGYITGGGSPKDTTGSEGFGIDTTEAASSEDIPHDNERFPVSSSASSDAGTWDSTFHANDEQTYIENYGGNKCKNNTTESENVIKSDSIIYLSDLKNGKNQCDKSVSDSPDIYSFIKSEKKSISIPNTTVNDSNDKCKSKDSNQSVIEVTGESNASELTHKLPQISSKEISAKLNPFNLEDSILEEAENKNILDKDEVKNMMTSNNITADSKPKNHSNLISDIFTEESTNSPRTNFFIDATNLSDENEAYVIPAHVTVTDHLCGTKSDDVKYDNENCTRNNVKENETIMNDEKTINLGKHETEDICSVPEDPTDEKPNLIRRNTFELEADDDKLALLRQEYEKRQGSTLFQSSSSSDISVGNSNGNEGSNGRKINMSPKKEHPDSLVIDRTGSYIPNIIDNDIQSPDSLNNDTHVKEYLEQNSLKPQNESNYFTENIICDKTNSVSNDTNQNPGSIVVNNPHSEPVMINESTDSHISTIQDTNMETLTFNPNSQLPVDNFNKIESMPIVSGGTKLSDISSEYNYSVSSSPVVSRRKTESAPIVSGGIDIVDMVSKSEVIAVQPKVLSPLTRSWVVDMSDAGKSINTQQSNRSNTDRNKTNNSGLGFFVPLDDPLSSLDNFSSSSSMDEKDRSNGNKKDLSRKQDNQIQNDQASSCGFFVDLKNDIPSTEDEEVTKKLPLSEDIPQVEKKLFSMFIDIGDSCSKSSDNTSPKSKTGSPFLTSKKFRPKNHADRFSVKNEKNLSTSSDSSMDTGEHPEVTKGKLLFSDESLQSSSQAVSDSSLQDTSATKKQSFFMFIEANSSPVPKKRNLPSGLRPNSQRHSWNVDYKKNSPENQNLYLKREHKRANSLSVDKTNFGESTREDRFQSGPASIDESGMKHRETNKPMMSSWHGPIKPSTELCRIIANGTKHEPKDFIKECKTTSLHSENENVDKVEELSCSIKSDDVYDTSNATNISSKDDHNRTFILDDVSKVVNANTNDLDVSTPSHDVVSDLSKDETETDPVKDPSSTCSNATNKSGDSAGVNEANEATPKASEHSASQHMLVKESEAFGFVKLSDMDKEPVKVWSSSIEKKTSRMSRSIPEGSWLEERLMTQSATSRSLSRLFPHLYPRKTPEPDEQDLQSSAHSSLQSSFDPSGLDCSTEGTEGSSVSGGPCSRLGEDLLRMFLEEISPDVTVEVGGRRIKAHKCILSSRCQYFAGILSGGWVESAGNVISLQGFSYNTVHFALCHIYSGASNVPDSINIVELATLADMLCLEGLKEVITYTLKVKYCHFFHKPCGSCTVGVLECLPLAAAYGLDEIYRKSLRWITRHFVRVWPTKEFSTLPKELQDKCYKQHVIHMCAENVLDTVMCCNKLEATIPNVRWAQSVFSLNSKLHDAAVKFLMQHFSAVISSDMFLSVGKEDAWTVGRIEGTLLSSAHTLSAEQACLSYGKLRNILTMISNSTLSPELDWKPEFVDLLCRLDTTVEDCLVRQAGRAARTSAWSLLDIQLRRKIQDMACLAFLPGDERRKSRHSSVGKHGELTRGQSCDSSQVKAKTSDLVVKREVPSPQTKPQTPTSLSQPPRPKKLSQVKSRYLDPKPVRRELGTNSDINKVGTAFGQRRVTAGKQLISSSDSSRTSSPATSRALVTRSRQRTKETDRMTMSTDSLCETKPTAPMKSFSTKSVPDNRPQHTPIPGRKSLPARTEPYKVKSAESISDKNTTFPHSQPLSKCKTVASCTSKKFPSEGSPSMKLKSAVSTPSPSLKRNTAISQSSNRTSDSKRPPLNRTSTFRVAQKSSSPSKITPTTPSSTREPLAVTTKNRGSVNREKDQKTGKSASNNNSPMLNGKSNNNAVKSRTLSVGSRSGTFLKEESTVLKKTDKVIE